MHPAPYAALITKVDPSLVVAWSAVDATKVTALADSMRRQGWVGRPVLVVLDSQGARRGLTASHRLAAAFRVLDTVPAVVLNAEALGLECDGEDVYVDGQRVADIDSLHLHLRRVDGEEARIAVALLDEEDEANARDDASLAA
jgi:hypothetical protein